MVYPTIKRAFHEAFLNEFCPNSISEIQLEIQMEMSENDDR